MCKPMTLGATGWTTVTPYAPVQRLFDYGEPTSIKIVWPTGSQLAFANGFNFATGDVDPNIQYLLVPGSSTGFFENELDAWRQYLKLLQERDDRPVMDRWKAVERIEALTGLQLITVGRVKQCCWCSDDEEIFLNRWPNGVELSRESLLEMARIGFSVRWIRYSPFTPKEKRAEFDALGADAWKACERAMDNADQAFKQVKARGWDETNPKEAAEDECNRAHEAAILTYELFAAKTLADVLGL